MIPKLKAKEKDFPTQMVTSLHWVKGKETPMDFHLETLMLTETGLHLGLTMDSQKRLDLDSATPRPREID